jgi:hypothetical protein
MCGVPQSAQSPISLVRLQLLPELSGVDLLDLIARLERTVNQPRWPRVRMRAHGNRLSFVAETWEPILRVRIESGLEQVLGVGWNDQARWL